MEILPFVLFILPIGIVLWICVIGFVVVCIKEILEWNKN